MDWGLLWSLLFRRLRFYVPLWLILFSTLLTALLFLFPRRYSTVSSIALQQNNGTMLGSSLASLANLSLGSGKVYDGVLHSRKFALEAVKAAKIRELYHLAQDDDAISIVQDSLMTEDPKNGLTYLHITLPGPPLLSPNSKEQEAKVLDAAKAVNDSLIASLQKYLVTSNADHDNVLLHQGKAQLDVARSQYDGAVQSLTRFIRTASTREASLVSTPAAPQRDAANVAGAGAAMKASSSTTDLAVAALTDLYQARGQLEINIRAAEETMRGQIRLAEESTNANRPLPAEDPLLSDSRTQLRQAQRALDELRITLSDTNPQVVTARANVAAARQRLFQEQGAISSNQTSAAVELSALRTRYTAVNRQIREAEQNFRQSRDYSTELLRLKNEVDLRLEVLKTAASQYAVLNVTSVAGDSLMDVVRGSLRRGHGVHAHATDLVGGGRRHPGRHGVASRTLAVRLAGLCPRGRGGRSLCSRSCRASRDELRIGSIRSSPSGIA